MISVVKKYLMAATAFILVYVLFVLILAPADKILAKITLPKGVYLNEISGSIYNGRAQTLIVNNQQINNVSWSFNFSSLIYLQPSVDVEFGSNLASGPRGNAQVSNFGAELLITDAKVNIGANELLTKFQLPFDLRAGGDINLSLNEFALGKPVCKVAVGDVQWSKAHVNAMDEDVELGNLQAELGCKNGILSLTVNADNDLGLDFTAFVGNRMRVSGQGYIKPGAKFPENVKPLLSLLGTKDSQGRYKLKL